MPAVESSIEHSEPGTIMLNIGGLANLSFSDESGSIGYDIGPGNCLIDIAAKELFGLDFDEDGRLAKQGTINNSHLKRLLEDPFFRLPHPKSTGREYFNKKMIKQLLDDVNANKSEKIATITALTTETIIKEVEKIGRSARFLKVFGGGARNTTIMNTLEKRLPHLKVSASVSSDFREALGFAILGYRRWHRILSETTTGASGPVLLGELYN